MDKNKKPIIVYWAVDEDTKRQYDHTLLDLKPKALISEINSYRPKNKYIPTTTNNIPPNPGDYQACSALHTLVKNVYVMRSPFNVNVSFTTQGQIIRPNVGPGFINPLDFFHERISSIEGAVSADYMFSQVFFCEEPLQVKLTPPYMHKTSQPEYGFVCSGQFDIGSWFRPFTFIYQLWKGKKEINIMQGEPIAYFHFETDRNIEFKEFVLDEDLVQMMQACVTHKTYKPFQKMEDLYKTFFNTNMNKKVIKSIKSNLI